MSKCGSRGTEQSETGQLEYIDGTADRREVGDYIADHVLQLRCRRRLPRQLHIARQQGSAAAASV